MSADILAEMREAILALDALKAKEMADGELSRDWIP